MGRPDAQAGTTKQSPESELNTQQFEQLCKWAETGMRAMQGADDELDQGEGRADLAVARHLIERCQEQCSQALRLLPRTNEAEKARI